MVTISKYLVQIAGEHMSKKEDLEIANAKLATKVKRLEKKVKQLTQQNADLIDALSSSYEELFQLHEAERIRKRPHKECAFCGRPTKSTRVSAGGIGPMCDVCYEDMCRSFAGSY
jgi:formylmethanofuran dehydrogenase subunit E